MLPGTAWVQLQHEQAESPLGTLPKQLEILLVISGWSLPHPISCKTRSFTQLFLDLALRLLSTLVVRLKPVLGN